MRTPCTHIALACLLAGSIYATEAARGLREQSEGEGTEGDASVRVIYSNGKLQSDWESWPWGVEYLNFEDEKYALPETDASMCTKIKPFGAVSLKTSKPFQAEGTLTFWQKESEHGDLNLEIQLESSVSVQYAVSSVASLGNEGDGESPIQVVSEASGGTSQVGEDSTWVKKEIRLKEFAESAEVFDRITLGRCLQQGDSCKGNQGDHKDKVVLVCLSEIQLEGQPDEVITVDEEGEAVAFSTNP
eukprot:scaffold1211_cov295-Pavlova_lutheri.AAC.14